MGASGRDPAPCRRGYFVESSRTGDRVGRCDDTLHKSCRGGNDLKGRTGRCLLLRRIVQQRIGQIIPQFGIICGIHAVCHLIVVIARIGNQSHGLAILNARHNDGAGIGIQRELGRGDIQILDPVYHKVVGCLRSRLKSAVLALIQFDDILFEQKAADLTAGHGIVVDQVAIDLFVEFFVFFQTLKNIVQNLLIDLDGIGIPGVDRGSTR